MIDPGTGDQYLKRRVTTGCYDVDVSNANDIWKSETVLFFYLPTLAAQVAFMLLSTRILYYILKPLNQPRLVSEILASASSIPQFASFNARIVASQSCSILHIYTYMHDYKQNKI
ncbi:hypothetical protein VIGAN_04407500 [Vigna angularis var. angularis]|uniref:Uncharacterized protein n=1 Tax=Vigna angularis var. angularis TaxID=157739 RepID=A0A0S3S0P8_PHAAN|nr:hypothetical protein VIGAN_04407500 [Vigna angularis var. angularis]